MNITNIFQIIKKYKKKEYKSWSKNFLKIKYFPILKDYYNYYKYENYKIYSTSNTIQSKYLSHFSKPSKNDGIIIKPTS